MAHLLLVAVLALGVFLMHSVGHPEGSGGNTSGASAPHHGTSQVDAEHVSAAHGEGSTGTRHEPGPGTDLTVLCVAVLGSWLLAGLVRAALGRRPDRLAPFLARFRPSLGPHAPPLSPPYPARSSVLRI
ncbi:hypothetical protein ACFW2Y_05010 [Streptomyces sp. NPDC058877]|uniref:hypothetical protein n=1 Tax=unclassified Streptomyces TaxID=2593676 RepID=UPI00368963EF